MEAHVAGINRYLSGIIYISQHESHRSIHSLIGLPQGWILIPSLFTRYTMIINTDVKNCFHDCINIKMILRYWIALINFPMWLVSFGFLTKLAYGGMVTWEYSTGIISNLIPSRGPHQANYQQQHEEFHLIITSTMSCEALCSLLCEHQMWTYFFRM